MLLKFFCANKDCRYKEIRPYLLKISSAYLHENGITELFCPNCKRKLIRQVRIGRFEVVTLKNPLGDCHVHQAIHDRKDRHYR